MLSVLKIKRNEMIIRELFTFTVSHRHSQRIMLLVTKKLSEKHNKIRKRTD